MSLSIESKPSALVNELDKLKSSFYVFCKEYNRLVANLIDALNEKWEIEVKQATKRLRKNKEIKKYLWMLENYTLYRKQFLNQLSKKLFKTIRELRFKAEFLTAYLKFGALHKYIKFEPKWEDKQCNSRFIVLRLTRPKKPKITKKKTEVVEYNLSTELSLMMEPYTTLLKSMKFQFQKFPKLLKVFNLYINGEKNSDTGFQINPDMNITIWDSIYEQNARFFEILYKSLFVINSNLNTGTQSLAPRNSYDLKMERQEKA